MVKCGASFDEVATALQVTIDDVENHFRDHAPIPSLSADPRSASDDELEQLLNDSTELYLQSVLQNNLTAASASLGVRLRTLSEKANRTEAKAESRGELLSADPEDCSTWSPELAGWIFRYQDALLARLDEAKRHQAEYEREKVMEAECRTRL